MEPLARFMSENILWSLGLAIRAAKGESIREVGDIDKEIALFVRRKIGVSLKTSDLERMDSVVHQWIRPTLKRLERSFEPLRDLFLPDYWGRSVDFWSSLSGASQRQVGLDLFEDWEKTKQTLVVKPGLRITDEDEVELGREFNFRNYMGRGLQGFHMKLSVTWRLGRDEVSVAAELDGEPITSWSRSVSYSELDARDVEADPTIDILSKAVMVEIGRRSEEGN